MKLLVESSYRLTNPAGGFVDDSAAAVKVVLGLHRITLVPLPFRRRPSKAVSTRELLSLLIHGTIIDAKFDG